jgi:hypothetical protein
MKMKWTIADLNQLFLDFYNNMILFSKSHIDSEAILTESLNKLEAVKEQRVDGSDVTDLNPVALRCTLMDFERNYQVKTLSKQLMSKNFSAFACSKLNPLFISGLIDAEGSFTLVISKNQKRKSGWRTDAKFQIGLYKRDLDLLYLLQQSLEGIGNIHKDRIRNRVIYSIDSIKDLTKLILHIDNYPLLTQKAADYILFKQAIDLLKNKMHLTETGLNKFIDIKASMNKGLSDKLKLDFKQYNVIQKPLTYITDIPSIF